MSDKIKIPQSVDAFLHKKRYASIVLVSLLMLLPYYTPSIYLPLKSFPRTFDDLKEKSHTFIALYAVVSALMMMLLSYMLFKDTMVAVITTLLITLSCYGIYYLSRFIENKMKSSKPQLRR